MEALVGHGCEIALFSVCLLALGFVAGFMVAELVFCGGF